MEVKRRRIRRENGRKLFNFIIFVLVLFLLVSAGLALWAQRGVLGDQGTPQHGRQAALILNALQQSSGSEMELGRDLRESDINGYIRHLRLKDLPFDDMSLDVMPDRVHLRVSGTMASWTCAGYCLAPTLSRDFTLYYDGAGVIIEQASVGHLPLPSSLARRAYARFLQQLDGAPELDLLAQAHHVILRKDRLHITFGGEK